MTQILRATKTLNLFVRLTLANQVEKISMDAGTKLFGGQTPKRRQSEFGST